MYSTPPETFLNTLRTMNRLTQAMGSIGRAKWMFAFLLTACGSDTDGNRLQVGATDIPPRATIGGNTSTNDSNNSDEDTPMEPDTQPPRDNRITLLGEGFISGTRVVSATENYRLRISISEPFLIEDADLSEGDYQLRSTLSFQP